VEKELPREDGKTRRMKCPWFVEKKLDKARDFEYNRDSLG
jgi:hypothetical protein